MRKVLLTTALILASTQARAVESVDMSGDHSIRWKVDPSITSPLTTDHNIRAHFLEHPAEVLKQLGLDVGIPIQLREEPGLVLLSQMADSLTQSDRILVMDALRFRDETAPFWTNLTALVEMANLDNHIRMRFIDDPATLARELNLDAFLPANMIEDAPAVQMSAALASLPIGWRTAVLEGFGHKKVMPDQFWPTLSALAETVNGSENLRQQFLTDPGQVVHELSLNVPIPLDVVEDASTIDLADALNNLPVPVREAMLSSFPPHTNISWADTFATMSEDSETAMVNVNAAVNVNALVNVNVAVNVNVVGNAAASYEMPEEPDYRPDTPEYPVDWYKNNPYWMRFLPVQMQAGALDEDVIAFFSRYTVSPARQKALLKRAIVQFSDFPQGPVMRSVFEDLTACTIPTPDTPWGLSVIPCSAKIIYQNQPIGVEATIHLDEILINRAWLLTE